jgi:hypothetical protein
MATCLSLRKPSSLRYGWAKNRPYSLADAGGLQATSGQYGNLSIPQEPFTAALRMGGKIEQCSSELNFTDASDTVKSTYFGKLEKKIDLVR